MNAQAQVIQNTLPAYTVRQITTEREALKIADIYIPYYKRVMLTKEAFLERWRSAQALNGFYMLGAYDEESDAPIGFIDFSIFPSIFWSPTIARIDSAHVIDTYMETDLIDALFKAAYQIMNEWKVSKIIAVTCAKYPKEARLLNKELPLDANPDKYFYMKILDPMDCK